MFMSAEAFLFEKIPLIAFLGLYKTSQPERLVVEVSEKESLCSGFTEVAAGISLSTSEAEISSPETSEASSSSMMHSREPF